MAKKIAKKIVYEKDGKEDSIALMEDDLVFITNGLLHGFQLLWRSDSCS
jgi:myosin-crossreactive antigen